MYVCMYACMYTCVCTYMYIYLFLYCLSISIYLSICHTYSRKHRAHTPPPPPTAGLRPSYRPFCLRATSRPNAPTARSMRACFSIACNRRGQRIAVPTRLPHGACARLFLNRVEQQRPTHRAAAQRGVGGHSGCTNRRGSALRAPPPFASRASRLAQRTR
jgi:hypothetical protein